MSVPRIEPVTPDLTQENIEKVLELFPNVGTEVKDPQTGEIKRAVDFDALREQLGDVAEGMRERYQFTWPGKRAAKEEARQPIAKTLRPVKDRSKNWDDTQNLYIEGDNLNALKILRENYRGQIKMIYIDPPYNTGHDFIYADNYRRDADDYNGDSGEYDEEGGRLVANPESNGRFHSDWCKMMYPRLLLARDLLSSDGAIFVSIDDGEVNNLRFICNEIFGASNLIGAFIWRKVDSPNDNHVAVTPDHEYVIAYCKNNNNVRLSQREAPEIIEAYNGPDDAGRYWRDRLLRKNGKNSLRTDRPTMYYPIIAPDGTKVWPIRDDGKEGRWAAGQESVNALNNTGDLIWKQRDGRWIPYTREYMKENPTKPWMTIWNDLPAMRQTKAEMRDLFNVSNIFDTPKPSALICRCGKLCGLSDNDIALDFFSGSASTAQAIMQLNKEDGANRHFIMVQIPEICNDASEAANAGYHTICEIGEERIRRAGEKIKAEIEQENQQLEPGAEPKRVPDIGFRVLRVDSSNYKDARRTPAETTQGALDAFVDVSKTDRESLDKLFECFPSLQLPYDASIEVLVAPAFAGHTVYSVNGNQLVACFDTEIPESVLSGMAALDPKPSYAVVSEAGLKNSQTVTNFREIFKQTANAQQGSTQIRII